MSQFSSEERITTWLRNGKDVDGDRTGDFKKVDQLLPQKRGEKPEDRARDIEGALDWMRNNNVTPEEAASPSFSNPGLDGHLPKAARSPKERKKDVEDIAM